MLKMKKILLKKKMTRSDISAKMEKSHKSPTLRGRHGNSKPNTNNLFYQILVNIPKILHAQKKIRLKKKWLGAMFWQNWVHAKMVKFRPLSISVAVRYSHVSVHKKVGRTVYIFIQAN
jgi:hypothetical protein